jgi:hypothetical protein
MSAFLVNVLLFLIVQACMHDEPMRANLVRYCGWPPLRVLCDTVRHRPPRCLGLENPKPSKRGRGHVHRDRALFRRDGQRDGGGPEDGLFRSCKRENTRKAHVHDHMRKRS